MKESRTRRGLYTRVTRSAENDAESFDLLRELEGELESYLDRLESFANEVLADSKSLPEWRDQAQDVLFHTRSARSSLSDQNGRDGLWRGIHVAQSFEKLQANIAFQESTRVGRKSISGGRKGAERLHGETGTKAAKYLEAYQARRISHPNEDRSVSRDEVGKLFGVTYKTIERATKGQ